MEPCDSHLAVPRDSFHPGLLLNASSGFVKIVFKPPSLPHPHPGCSSEIANQRSAASYLQIWFENASAKNFSWLVVESLGEAKGFWLLRNTRDF